MERKVLWSLKTSFQDKKELCFFIAFVVTDMRFSFPFLCVTYSFLANRKGKTQSTKQPTCWLCVGGTCPRQFFKGLTVLST